jgi:P27 family predicted phage terminase small subunit
MGLRGRKPKSEVGVLALTPRTRAKPPKGFPDKARGTWKRIVNSLPHDHFRLSDLPLLEKYCMADCIYWQAMQKVLDRGELAIVTEKGYSLPDIYLTVANKQVQIMTALSGKLRLAPNSRISHSKAGFEKEERPASTRAGLKFGGRE